jgi:hypothetical protein
MSRRIVFAGGVQTRALARIYRSEIAVESGDDVVFIGSGALGTEAARSALQLADVLASEVDEDGDAVTTADRPARAEFVRIPNLYADFLWPFAGRSHPKNRGPFALPGGPYPAEHGDRFLDQLAAEGVGTDEAIHRYLTLDIVREGELDSRLSDRLTLQRRLDAVAGFDLTDYIADNFRTIQLFRTRQRITQPLLRRLVHQLLPKLGVRGFSAELLARVPFPASAQPVHPGVAAHFRLDWAGPGARYPVNEEGYFTFEQFCRRYLDFTWNETLHRGIQTAKTQPAAALADLEAGLEQSPESPLGQRALAVARHAAGLAAAPAATLIDEDSYNPVEEPAALSAPPADVAPEAAAPDTDMPAAEPADAPPQSADATAPPAAEAAPEPADAAESAAPPEPDAGEQHAAEEDDALEALRTRYAAPARPANLSPAPAEFGVTADGFTDFGQPTGAGAKPQAEKPPASPAPPAPAPYDPAHHGFTDFGKPPGAAEPEPAAAQPGSDLIDVLPQLLPAFTDLAGTTERPFAAMPEVMPPPPLRPILPPELESDGEKRGLFARILGRKSTQ